MRIDLINLNTWFDHLLQDNAATIGAEIERRFSGRRVLLVVDDPSRSDLEIYNAQALERQRYLPDQLALYFTDRRLFFGVEHDRADFPKSRPLYRAAWYVSFKGDSVTFYREREGDQRPMRIVLQIIDPESA